MIFYAENLKESAKKSVKAKKQIKQTWNTQKSAAVLHTSNEQPQKGK
jgi:hypothetical protein